MKQNAQTPEQMIEAIFALDLDPIKFKLMDAKEGHGWSRARADQVELDYKRFLALLAKYPDEVIAPDTDIDKFWHGHILDTMKYAQDCQRVFGYFLHHFPYFGLRDAEDAVNLARAAQNMRSLYEREFGAALKGEAGYCARADAAYCARAEASYCARAVDAGQAASTAYCARAVGRAEALSDAAYCARAAAAPDVVTGKGRPGLQRADAA